MSIRIGLSKASGSPKYENYIRWLTSSDFAVEIVDLSLSSDLEGDLSHIDALVLTGGADVNPDRYGHPELAGKCGEIDDERDRNELRMLALAEERELPVLGICRGIQVLNVYKGGTLIAHVPDVVDGGERHVGREGRDQRHDVEITPGSLLLRTTGKLGGEVNSAHHQAVGELGAGLVATARSADGVVEGIELADRYGSQWLLGIQWHPERMDDRDSNPLARDILGAFLFEAESSRILASGSPRATNTAAQAGKEGENPG